VNSTPRSFAIAALAFATSAYAASDPTGDLLASFAGNKTVAAFDIVSSDVTFDSAAGVFLLHARTAGAIAEVGTAAYVFGFNRGGAANSPFSDIGVPGVSFNATALLRSNGTGNVGANAITAQVDGSDISAVVSASLFPPSGFAPETFTWALWSIDTSIVGNTRNADFGPAANIPVAAVPEPETYALMLAGTGLLGVFGRFRRRRQQ